ncbi:hypothetical protein MUP79_00250, partial [Candidatus Bathyarchaeota archaeon]|nr:hypothetical protein [Candidatus Bathyarchaeota archaeon]
MAPVYKASAAGALDHIVFSNISTQRAGTAFDLAITAVDVQNSTVTSYVETNTLNISTGTISPTSTSSFKNGSWTGQVTLTRAATGVTISTSGSNKTGTSNSFAVNPGALASFNMTGYPTSVTAGTSFGSGNNVIVTTFDAYGNTKTDYRGSVYFTSTDTQAVFTYSSGSSYTFTSHDNGVHTFAGTGFILKTSGPQTIRATDGTIFKDSTSITVNPGALASFTITGYPTSVTSGQNLGSNNVVVTAYDGYGNIKTDYVGSVYFDSTDAHSDLPFTSGNKYTFTSGASQDNGVHTFAGAGFTLKTTPSQTITVTDGSRSATSNSITVNPKPVTTRSIIITSNPTGSGYIRVDGQTYVTPATFNWTIGNMHTISADSPVIIISNQSRYIYSSWSDSGSQSHIITVSLRSASTFTANFRLQYYLFVSGGNGNGAGWYNSNASASSTASYVLNQVPRQSRNNLYQKIVDGIPTSLSRANSGTSTQSFTMSTYHTITWSYRTQYYLTNSLLNGSQYSVTASPTRDSWYDAGTSVSTALNNVWGIVTNQSRSNLVRFFNGTVSRTVSRAGTGTATFTIAMTTYRTINDTSVRQYYLSLTGGGSTSYGTASPTSDSWYDNGTSTTVTSSWVWNIVAGRSRTAITSYTIDGSSQSLSRRGDGILTTPSFSMTTYHTVAFSSTTQYFLNVTGGYSVSYGTASPTSDNWYDSGSSTTVSSLWVWNTVSNQSRVAISNWQLDGINQNPARRNSGNLTSTSISMLTYHRFNFVSTIQYYFTVSGGNGVTFGTVSQTSDNWYDSGTSTTVSSNWAWNVVSGKNRTAIMNWQLDSVNQTFLFSNGFENGTGTGFTEWNFAHASGTGSTAVVSLAPHSGTSDAK